MTDEQLISLRRGGHDPLKVYAAYKAAVDNRGAPTVILAQTIKGYGMGEAGEGRNITHQQKKLNEQELLEFRARFNIPISEEQAAHAEFYKPPADSPEMVYLRQRRAALGGFVPGRRAPTMRLKPPKWEEFAEFFAGSEGREVSSTMAFVRLLVRLLRDKNIGRFVVPIVPDEARTFGMEALFRQFGIYAHAGQLYEPVDSDNVLYYREAVDGQILEEGINEAGSMASFIAAASSRSSHGVSMIPFFIYYSMFGFQRIGDLIWAAGDMRCRGFLLGGTAGRTTLAGEGLQHQDGNSHLNALAFPTVMAYDPCYAYELSVIVLDGIRKMYYEDQDVFYYITLMNENYEMPILPLGSTEGICKGIYRLSERRLGTEVAAREAFRQRRDPPRDAAGPGAAGAEVRRRQQRLQRDELQESLLRRPRLRSLEPPAPGRIAAAALRRAGSRRRSRSDRGRFRLHCRRAPGDRPLGRSRLHRAGHRWLRPQRGPCGPAAVLRGRCREHRPDGAGAPGPQGRLPQGQSLRSDQDAGARSEQAEPGGEVEPALYPRINCPIFAISSAESSIFPAAAFSLACWTSRAPQSTHVMPGCAAVQAMTNCPIVAPCRSAIG